MKISPAPMIPYFGESNVRHRKPDVLTAEDTVFASDEAPVAETTVYSLNSEGLPDIQPAAYRRSMLLDIRV